EPAWGSDAESRIAQLNSAVLELEYTWVPFGMHEVGRPPSPAERAEMLLAIAEAAHGLHADRPVIEALVQGAPISAVAALLGEHSAQNV
ncbi:hypothetical protein ABTK80_20790, partial [Acinetobacter baumannii]